MLLKLIKYDLKATYAKMILTFAAFTIICIITPTVLVQIQNSAAMIFVGLAIPFGIMALFVLTFVFLFQRYNSNFYSSEGYLMFTLPTTGKKLLASKLIAAFIWTVIATALFAGAFGVMFYVFSKQPEFLKLFARLMGNLEINFSQVVLVAVAFVTGTAAFFLEIYFAISVSKLPVWHKFGVLMGFVTFFGVNLISSIPSWLVNGAQVFNDSLSYSIGNQNKRISFFHMMSDTYSWGSMWVGLLTAAVLSVALFFVISLLLEKKTSLK